MAELQTPKIQTPKEKWKILRTFIENKKLDVQHRRQHIFGLFKSRKMEECEISVPCTVDTSCSYLWLEYYRSEEFSQYRLAVRQRVRAVNWDDAIGFDNTGNICIWPSEEILSYLCIKNRQDFSRCLAKTLLALLSRDDQFLSSVNIIHIFKTPRDKVICEIGAGMTGLAGMMLAIASGAKEVIITDGNIDSVKNLELMTMENNSKFGETIVKSRALMWNKKEDYGEYKNYFDYVICADCLFYEEAQDSLLDLMYTVLKSGGKVIVLSPLRGNTVEKFIQRGKRVFEVEQVENYDDHLWSLYIQVWQRVV